MRWWPSLLLLLVACDPDTTGEDTDPMTDTAVCSTLDWDTFAEGHLRSWCTGCHHSDLEGPDRYGAPDGIDFDTEADALDWGERILARATGDAPSMPPVGGAEPDERDRLAEWLICQGVQAP